MQTKGGVHVSFYRGQCISIHLNLLLVCSFFPLILHRFFFIINGLQLQDLLSRALKNKVRGNDLKVHVFFIREASCIMLSSLVGTSKSFLKNLHRPKNRTEHM